MAKCLIILTSQYPYFSGEPFLESEIKYHSQNFDKVLVFPLDAGVNDEPTRLLPNGIEAINTAKTSKTAGRLSDYMKGGFHSLTAMSTFKEETSRIGKSFPRRLFFEYFEVRANRHFNLIKKSLDAVDFSFYDEITIYSYWLFVTARVACLLKKYFNEKGIFPYMVARAHRYDCYEYANPLKYLPMRLALLSEMDEIYPCSADAENYLCEAFPEFSEKINVSYLGTRYIGTCEYDDVFRIVSCSRTADVKRIDRIIDSLALLEGSEIEFEWTHIGDGKELEKLKSAASVKLKFMKVNFLGSLSNHDVLDYYLTNKVSAFVNASSSEGIPVSIMEAASFGIPTVATDVGGTGELVIENITGFLIEKDFTDNDLANAIMKLAVMDQSDYSSLRKSTREYWRSNFCAEKNYSSFSEQLSKNKKIKRNRQNVQS